MSDIAKQKCIERLNKILMELNERDRPEILDILNECKAEEKPLKYGDEIPVVVFEDILEYFNVLLDQIRVSIDVVTYSEDVTMKEIKSLFRIQSYMLLHIHNLISRIAKESTGVYFEFLPDELT